KPVDFGPVAVAQQFESARELVDRLGVVVRAVGRIQHHAAVAELLLGTHGVVVQRHLGAAQRELVGVEGDRERGHVRSPVARRARSPAMMSALMRMRQWLSVERKKALCVLLATTAVVTNASTKARRWGAWPQPSRKMAPRNHRNSSRPMAPCSNRKKRNWLCGCVQT